MIFLILPSVFHIVQNVLNEKQTMYKFLLVSLKQCLLWFKTYPVLCYVTLLWQSLPLTQKVQMFLITSSTGRLVSQNPLSY